ncbi:MAG: hypothetical protein COZ98_01215 [Candidatus Omnitrophica bacterium CG_4_8_14_3_um_filter_43_15]|nr:MAG: hypothetical protein COS29_03320 [Candidatus Omnitrophica bacterium CG02_land_8_20_14_3_00__42_8]PIW80652.1 MAG: hypothetical protein COZ98_01215 [Candidatus Omnitrophica bacterium CG_4_8_14_3_um_filter_43_15]
MIPRKNYFVILFALSFIAVSVFIFYFNVSLVKDAAQYDAIAVNIAGHNGFSDSVSAPYLPTMYREPVYPYFLAALFWLFGHNYYVVLFVQAIIFAFTCLVTYFVAREIFSEDVARCAGLFTAACLTLANYAVCILSEAVFTFFLCLLIFFLIKFVKSQRQAWVAASAVVLALLAMTKMIMFLFVVPVLTGILILACAGRISFKSVLKACVIFTLFFALFISPWSARNKRLFGTYAITLRQGVALAARAERLDDSSDFMKESFVYNISEFLGRKFFPKASVLDVNFIMQGSRNANLRFLTLTQKDALSGPQADKIMKEEALARIKRRPFKYMLQSLFEFQKLAMFLNVPALNEAALNAHSLRKVLIVFLRGFLKLLSLFVLGLAAAGAYFYFKKWHLWVFIFFLAAYLNFANSMIFGDPRYAAPLIPFYIIFATAGWFGIRRKQAC